MKTYTTFRRAAAIFAANTLLRFGKDLPSITITSRGSSEDYSVTVAINSWSEEIEKTLDSIFSDAVSSTSTVSIPDCSPQKE